MRLDVVAENLLERVIRRLNLAPVPLMHTHVALLLARAVMEASRAGVFEAAASGPQTPREIAGRCALDPGATAKLVDALTASGYFTPAGGRYALTPMARKWMLASSPQSVHDKMAFQFVEAGFIDAMGDYLRSGADVTGSGHLGDRGPEFWQLYQRAMRSVASISAAEVARRTWVPRGARAMIDIGGSHGLYSVVLCRRYPALSSTILDLPAAVRDAAPLLAAEGMGDRVRYREGDVRRTDLGEAAFDLVFVSNLLHHFDEAANRDLMTRIARALRPGGAVVVQELARRESPADGGQPGALLDLYFALTSEGGAWSTREIAGWQRDAGLAPRRPLRLRSMPLGVQQTAIRRR